MANVDNPTGFIPVSSNTRRNKYTVGATAVSEGDLVSLVDGLLVLYTGAYPPVGIMAEDGAVDAEAIVYDDLSTTDLMCQFDGVYAADTAGKCYDVKGATGAMQVDGANQKFGVVEVLGLYPVVGSPGVGQDAKVRCRIVRSQLVGGTTMIDPFLMSPGYVATLADDTSLASSDGKFIKLDPGGAGRNVTLGATLNRRGAFLVILNAADAAENLTIKNSAGSTLGVLNQNQGCWAFNSDGSATGWTLMGFSAVVDLSS